MTAGMGLCSARRRRLFPMGQPGARYQPPKSLEGSTISAGGIKGLGSVERAPCQTGTAQHNDTDGCNDNQPESDWGRPAVDFAGPAYRYDAGFQGTGNCQDEQRHHPACQHGG
jgi:hypothetical protein